MDINIEKQWQRGPEVLSGQEQGPVKGQGCNSVLQLWPSAKTAGKFNKLEVQIHQQQCCRNVVFDLRSSEASSSTGQHVRMVKFHYIDEEMDETS